MTTYVAIHPMAMIHSNAAWLCWIEWKHPHEPKAAEIAETLRSMTPEEQKATLSSVKLQG